jgi:hypothetical protein
MIRFYHRPGHLQGDIEPRDIDSACFSLGAIEDATVTENPSSNAVEHLDDLHADDTLKDVLARTGEEPVYGWSDPISVTRTFRGDVLATVPAGELQVPYGNYGFIPDGDLGTREAEHVSLYLEPFETNREDLEAVKQLDNADRFSPVLFTDLKTESGESEPVGAYDPLSCTGTEYEEYPPLHESYIVNLQAHRIEKQPVEILRFRPSPSKAKTVIDSKTGEHTRDLLSIVEKTHESQDLPTLDRALTA